MKEYIYIKGELVEDMIPDLIASLSEIQDCEELIVFLSSVGGTLHTVDMITMLLQDSRFGKVTIIPSGYVYSAAWRFILTCPFEVRYIDYITAMDHKSTMFINDVPVVHDMTFGNKSEILRKQVSIIDGRWYTFCKDIAKYTDEELKMFEDGSDVYFDSDRVKEIINNVKNGTREIS